MKDQLEQFREMAQEAMMRADQAESAELRQAFVDLALAWHRFIEELESTTPGLRDSASP